MSIFYTVAFWVLVAIVAVLSIMLLRFRACIRAQYSINNSVGESIRSLIKLFQLNDKKH